MKADGYRYCLGLLREHDPDRHLAVLWLPQEQRGAAAAIYAFAAEIGRIPSLVEEPANGEIRLQWWSEVVAGERDHGGQPVAGELLAVLGATICRRPFARSDRGNPLRSLPDPMPT